MAGLKESELDELKNRLREEFLDYYEMAGGKNYRFHHLVRAHRYVVKLIERPEIRELDFDQKVLEVAALFHDIGRKEDIEDGFLDPIEAHEGHDETGEEIVDEYVEEFLTEEQLAEVKEIIGNHHSEPERVETRILQDADTLGIFGPLNIWRMIHYASDNERPLEDTFEYFWSEGTERRIKKMQELNFDCSKRIARKRMKDFQETMQRIEEEHFGEDI
ncbi:HD domain-containing protein [Candidatus Nanosalina sp. VS9-1]|uniref:HD domain-containing protein n=1 Tax=Candidatus Nanosalina sp. VS9-1 TaxID=3388566 RepID=UPI0039DFA56F